MHYDHDYFAHARIGLFTHYAYGTYNKENNYGSTWHSAADKSPAADSEEAASLLDAKKFAEAAADMGAQYVVFTLCHAGFNLLFPSETMAATGLTNKYSKTDAVKSLLDELDKFGIPLILYMPPNDNHDLKPHELEAMGWQTNDGRELFINTLLDEIGRRYSGRVAGFWFDQGGPRASALEVIRRHNPDAVVYINTGVTANENQHPLSDFLVSEYYGTFPEGDSDTFPVHHSQVNRIFGGSWWACGKAALTDARSLYRYMIRTIAVTGQLNSGINYACGPYLDQTWETGVREIMHDFGELVRKNAYAICDTVPGKSFVTSPSSTLGKSQWGVSTESRDGKHVYLHILNLPENGILDIGESADGRKFSAAYLGDTQLEFDGQRIVLPDGCDPIDTVVTLV